MPSKRPAPVRSPAETTLSASINKKRKQALYGRAELLSRSSSQLIGWALAYMEETGWKGVPDAMLDDQRQKQLDRWLKEGNYPLDK